MTTSSNKLPTWFKQHPLISTLVNLEGNPRACVYTEPLWGIP